MPLSRRDFIKSASLFGASVALAGPTKTLLPSGGKFTIGNGFFAVSFDTGSGTFEVRRQDGRPLLTGATSCLNFAAAAMGQAAGRRRVADGGFRYTAHTRKFTDRLGQAVQLAIHCMDGRRLTDVEVQLSLYDEARVLAVEAICTNVSPQDIAIHSLEPVRAAAGEGGVLHVPEVSKCLTNGEMYFDAGSVHTFGSQEGAISSGRLKGVSLSPTGPSPAGARPSTAGGTPACSAAMTAKAWRWAGWRTPWAWATC
jgi:hypothetical protein